MSQLPTKFTIASYEVMMHYFKHSNTSPLTDPLFSFAAFPSIYVSRFSKAQQLSIKYNHEFAQDQSSSAFNVNKLSRYLEDPKEMRRQAKWQHDTCMDRWRPWWDGVVPRGYSVLAVRWLENLPTCAMRFGKWFLSLKLLFPILHFEIHALTGAF
ncbi:hypothetical protein WN944_026733 [Citrus x changshan-huyou]|uniref:Uncharacterized protein n=1 Tax=Citrus x changshan-huyou TaxID=2935761 RepID=A0AAP0LWU0_9ROSI